MNTVIPDKSRSSHAPVSATPGAPELHGGSHPPNTLEWVSWPLRDEPPQKTLALLAIMALTAVIACFVMGIYGGVMALILLFILLGPYFLPTRYRVSEDGVESRFPLFNRSRPWGTYKRFTVLKDGIFLGTFPRVSRLDSFRGEFLRFTGDMDRSRVLDLVKRHVPSSGNTDA